MTFAESIRSVLSQYATFSGRARRSEYWWFYLFVVMVTIAAMVVDAALGLVLDNDIGVVETLVTVALVLPSCSAGVRRLHDTGRTGWWLLLPLPPLGVAIVAGVLVAVTMLFDPGLEFWDIALIVVMVAGFLLTIAASVVQIVMMCRDSDPGPNKYGPSPKPPLPSPETGGYGPYAGHLPPY